MPSESSSSCPWVGWGRSGLTVEMKPCLQVSGRLSSPPPWVPRSQRLRRSRSQLVVCRKFQIDCLGDHLCTCTAHSGTKKAHDWAVDQIADLFRTTHKVKTQQVVKSRGQHCGDIEIAGYLANAAGPVPLVLDLHLAHERWVSSADPTLNGNLQSP